MNEQNAFPLAWPPGRPRTNHSQKSNFGERSIERATSELRRQLRLLGVVRFVLSTNVELRQDGFPRSDRRTPDDPGVAVYFRLKERPIVFSCDKWTKVQDNLWAIVNHIDALRGTARWGCGELTQAFAGYAALPAPADLRPWFEVLGVHEACSIEEARRAWIEKSKFAHPDAGGSDASMSAVNGAWARAKQVLG